MIARIVGMETAGSLVLQTLVGDAVRPVLDAVARLRMEVFRDWPYLYEGEAAYHWPWWQQVLGTSWLWLLLAGYALLWSTARRSRRRA